MTTNTIDLDNLAAQLIREHGITDLIQAIANVTPLHSPTPEPQT